MSLSFLRTGFKGRFPAWLLHRVADTTLRASGHRWGGHCGFSVLCCFVFAVLTGSAGWRELSRDGGSCWRPVLLGTLTSRCLPPFCSPRHTRNPTGKEREGACEGAGPLLPLRKQKIRRGLREGALY